MNIQAVSNQLASKVTAAIGQDGARLLNALQYGVLWLWASGTTGQRPRDPVLGQLYYDTTLVSTVVCTTVRNGATPAVWMPIGGGGGGGTVTSITATSPIIVTPSPITNTGVVSHATSGVTAATYGSSTQVGQVTVDVNGHVTNAANVTITSAVVADSYIFGDGRDGAFVFDGTNTYTAFSKSGNNYTANQWVFATNMTINAGVTVHNGNFPLFCNGTLTNNGKIGAFGNDAVGSTGGAVHASTFFRQSPLGPNGGSGAGTAGNGAGAGTNCLGGAGGASGSGAGGAGAAGGGVNPPSVNAGGVKAPQMLVYPFIVADAAQGILSAYNLAAGSGASGGGDGVGTSGGGGGCGGTYCWLAVVNLAGNGTISCAGGVGGNGHLAGGAGAGGGGGGGGGCLWFYTTTPNPTSVNTFTVAGGAGGASAGTGVAGTAGSPGNSYIFVVA